MWRGEVTSSKMVDGSESATRLMGMPGSLPTTRIDPGIRMCRKKDITVLVLHDLCLKRSTALFHENMKSFVLLYVKY